MEGKRRYGIVEDSLVVEEGISVKFPLVPFAMCLLLRQLLLQGFFHQEEIKHPHCRYTQRPKIMNDMGPPEPPADLPLATPSCLPEQYNHCGKNFYKKKQPVQAYVGGPWSKPFHKNTARHISG